MNIKKLVKQELSGTVAKDYVSQICRFHRIQGSPMFHEAADYVKNELQRLGLQDATIEQYPADGKTQYWTHTSPIGWTVKTAELSQVEPEPETLLCTYEDCPQSLHTFSKATPLEGVVADLIDVGIGTKPKDYEGKNIQGKLVLATGRARIVHTQAVFKYGAAGVITDSPMEMPNVREGIDIPDAHAYQGIWPTAKDLPKTTFGFSISKRQGNQLRALLQAGKTVRLKAKVNAALLPFHEDVVTTTIRGSAKPDEEVFLIAHLCHPKPSANDNASGSGLLIEIARTFQTLISAGKIPRPTRTIRFLWVPETLGTIAYLSSHPEASKCFIAGVNLDMVGQNQELCRSALSLDRTPDSCPSYLNDFVFSLIEQTVKEFDSSTHFGSGSTFRYRTTAFSGGSDHAEFTEATTAVPCVMLLQWPDLYYHTSMDTIDKVSEDMLKRVGWIAAMAALTLANGTHEDVLMLACETASKATARIAEVGVEALKELLGKCGDPKLRDDRTKLASELAKTAAYHKSKVEHLVWRDTQAIKSVRRLGEHPELTTLVDGYCEDTTNAGKRELAKLQEALAFIAKSSALKIPETLQESPVEQELRRLIPKRLFKGTLSGDLFKDLLGEKEHEWYDEISKTDPDFGKKMAEIVNFIDGIRNADDIFKAVSAEYSPTDPEQALKYLRDLEKTKLVIFR